MSAMPTSPLPRAKGDDQPGAEMLSGRWQERKALPDANAAELAGRIDEVLAVLKERAPYPAPEYHPPAGGIEARIAHLEASTAHLQRDVAQVRNDVREIRERLARVQERATRLPSRGFLTVTALALIAAVFGAAGFQAQIQAVVLQVLG